jgi:DNA helicase II / ATP-dependent DNA helicase PcrA
VEAGILAPLPTASEFTENPLGDSADTMVWPLDPLGHRRDALQMAAERVRTAVPGDGGVWEAELDLLLEERRRGLDSTKQVTLPTRVPASRFKDYVADAAAVAAALRRPMPQKPYRATRLGTLFHSWVEERFTVPGSGEVIDAIEGELDVGDAVDEKELTRLQGIFEHSPWGSLRPIDVEREIHLPFAGRLVICKIDAVYERDGRIEIVDWKTGKAPKDAADLQSRQLQLALYRLAYARHKHVDPALIDAVFYFVADDLIVRPERLLDEHELLELWQQSVG